MEIGPVLRDPQVVQYAWLVNDLDSAIARWTRTLGAGPFFVLRNLEWENPHYRGRPLRTDYSVALGQIGDVHVELLEQHDDTPSVYRDIHPAGREGFHHVARLVDDVDAEMERFDALGFPEVFRARRDGSLVAFADTSPLFGGMTEIVQDSPVIRQMLAMLKQASLDWDGVTDPVRSLG